jgi:hypothetical protein
MSIADNHTARGATVILGCRRVDAAKQVADTIK